MGLFGGFKGKLIGKNRTKKKSESSQVVCVKFHTFSEFDNDNSPSTSGSNQVKVVKERQKITKPDVKNIFEETAVKANGTANFDNGQIFETVKTAAVKKQEPPAPLINDLKVDTNTNVNFDKNAKKQAPPTPEDLSDDDGGNFTIHVAQNSQIFDSSDEEKEFFDNEDMSPVNYSSLATSIFFGGEEEPVVMRPRNLVFNEDYSSDGSADA